MLWPIIILSITCASNVVAKPKWQMIRVVQIKEYVGCNNKTLPFHQEGITINVTGRGIITLNGHLDIDEDVGNLTEVSVRIEKCRSMADKASCEFFMGAKYDNPCSIIMAKGMLWSPSFDRVKPRLSCPFKKGVHVIQESTLDPSVASKFIKPGDFWRVMVKLLVGKRLVSCFKVGAEMVELRERKSQ